MRDRGRLSRNPISLLVFFGLAEVAAAQLVFGPEGSVVVLSMPRQAQAFFAWLLLGSALLVLVGGTMPEPRAYWLEAGGKAGCAIALVMYTITLPSAVQSWNTGLGLVFGAIAIGCLLRLGWLSVLIVANFYPQLWARILCVHVRLRQALYRFRR
jgi:hypothetical protein